MIYNDCNDMSIYIYYYIYNYYIFILYVI
jgi:hypothetical protein